ncbi:AbfB domain-containing protein [Actinomycetes bacterium KLBMP 9797]
MSDEDDRQTRLRVGGWLPSPDPTGQIGGSALAKNTTKDVVLSPSRRRMELATHARRFSRRQLALAGVTVVVALVLLGIAAVQRSGVAPATVAQSPPGIAGDALDWLTSAPTTDPGAPLVPWWKASTEPSGTAGPGGGAKPAAPARPTADGPTEGGPAATPAAPTTPAVSLRAGARVGLEPVTHPGYRVRHRQFAGWIDRIGAGSGAQDRADAAFTVRAGLASASCVSFEAVNYPGYYLRHQNFQIYLHRRESTALFAADATFCAGTGLTGQHTSLRSYNYPQRYLHHRDARLGISTVDAGAPARAAATFIVRTPL